MTKYQGINLLDLNFLAYAQWLLSHSEKLPLLQAVGQTLIKPESTPKQRAEAVRDILNILIDVMDDAPNEIFGAEGEDAPQEAFTAVAEQAESNGINILMVIEIINVIMTIWKKRKT